MPHKSKCSYTILVVFVATISDKILSGIHKIICGIKFLSLALCHAVVKMGDSIARQQFFNAKIISMHGGKGWDMSLDEILQFLQSGCRCMVDQQLDYHSGWPKVKFVYSCYPHAHI